MDFYNNITGLSPKKWWAFTKILTGVKKNMEWVCPQKFVY